MVRLAKTGCLCDSFRCINVITILDLLFRLTGWFCYLFVWYFKPFNPFYLIVE